MRVLLISANTEQMNMPVLPLGLGCVAAALDEAGHDIRVLNLMARKDTSGDIRDAISGFAPEAIGISVRNIDDQSMENTQFLLEDVKRVVSSCKKFSDAPVILGGAGYSIFAEAALEYLDGDYGIKGEGEAALPALLEKLSSHADLSGFPGLYIPGKGLQGDVKPTRNLDRFPMPLPGAHMDIPEPLKDQEIRIPIQSRRGCAMKCSYCSTSTIEGCILRSYSPNRVVDMIKAYVAQGMNHFYFVDNTFNLPPSYAMALCDQIIDAGLEISWRCILYPMKVDEELVEKMARAGCSEVALGFESGAAEILSSLNKRFELEEVIRISEILGNFGIQRLGFLLLGGPKETRETVIKSLEFSELLAPEALKITVGIRIYPYTELARIALEEGIISADQNLLYPAFYLAPGLKTWLPETIGQWLKSRPNWFK